MQEVTHNQQAIKTYLPQLFNETGVLKKSGILSLAPKTLNDAVRTQTPQLALLTKECGPVITQAAISIILKDVFDLTLSPAASNPDAMAAMCMEIQTNFWMLKFDEIVFAVKKGINAGYTGKEGKHFGHINYQHISEWLNAYLTESAKAIADLRDIEHLQYKNKNLAVEALSGVPSEVLQKIGADAEKKERETRIPKMPDKEQEKKLEDGYKLVQFDRFRKAMHTNRMMEWEKEAEENGWERTLIEIRKELKDRCSYTIIALAKKIASGSTDFTTDELQTQQNFPHELEVALKNLKEK